MNRLVAWLAPRIAAAFGVAAAMATPQKVHDLDEVEGQEASLFETLREQGASHRDQRRYGLAAAMFREALAIRPDDSSLLTDLGSSLQWAGEWAESETFLRRALEVDRETLGSDHSRVADDLNNLAHLFQVTDRWAEAEPLLRRALEIDERNLGPDHTTVATRLNNLAAILEALGRLREAEPLLRRALRIDEKSLGSEHRPPDGSRAAPAAGHRDR
jgi:tetratricopeptide (TPR) repeat protein